MHAGAAAYMHSEERQKRQRAVYWHRRDKSECIPFHSSFPAFQSVRLKAEDTTAYDGISRLPRRKTNETGWQMNPNENEKHVVPVRPSRRTRPKELDGKLRVAI
jgi:hypothetical protein